MHQLVDLHCKLASIQPDVNVYIYVYTACRSEINEADKNGRRTDALTHNDFITSPMSYIALDKQQIN